MKKIVMFDLDGTILDSKPGIFRSIAYAMEHLRLPIPPESTLMGFLGPPITDGFEKVCGVPTDRVEDAVRLYREYYNGGGKFEANIYDGVRELLLTLKNRGCCCCVTTSKPHVFARQILEHFQMTELFDGIYGSELDGTRGHKSEVVAFCLEQQGFSAKDAVLIGDRHFDMNGANALGIPCIGVLYGYGTREELETAGAVRVVETPDDVLVFVLK